MPVSHIVGQLQCRSSDPSIFFQNNHSSFSCIWYIQIHLKQPIQNSNLLWSASFSMVNVLVWLLISGYNNLFDMIRWTSLLIWIALLFYKLACTKVFLEFFFFHKWKWPTRTQALDDNKRELPFQYNKATWWFYQSQAQVGNFPELAQVYSGLNLENPNKVYHIVFLLFNKTLWSGKSRPLDLHASCIIHPLHSKLNYIYKRNIDINPYFRILIIHRHAHLIILFGLCYM